MKSLILILILVNGSLSWYIFEQLKNESFIAFLNVGQGNSVLIYNRRLKILYDAGSYGLRTIREIQNISGFYDRKIDLIIISHPDKDHYGGVFDIIDRYQVGAVIFSPYLSEESGYLKLIELIKNKKIPIITLKSLDKIETPFEKILILHPDKRYKDNQNSLVLKVIKNNQDFLLTGDIDQKIEKYLLLKYPLLIKSYYLLLPHHGSKYSSHELFLANFIKAIIQVGDNHYGHPHQETIDRLRKLKIPYWRTDLNGRLIIRAND